MIQHKRKVVSNKECGFLLVYTDEEQWNYGGTEVILGSNALHNFVFVYKCMCQCVTTSNA